MRPRPPAVLALAAGLLVAGPLLSGPASATAITGTPVTRTPTTRTPITPSTVPGAPRMSVPLRHATTPVDVRRLLVTYREGAGAVPGERVIGQRSVGIVGLAAAVPVTGRLQTVELATPLPLPAAAEAARQLAADPRVQSAEPDVRLHLSSATAPDDPLLVDQWPLTAGAGVHPAPAWRRTRGSGVVVAVLDTGTTAHPDLAGRVLPGYDMVSDPALAADGGGRDGDASDPGDAYEGEPSSWHGTHVTGTVVATADNGVGIAGLAPRALVEPVRVLGAGGGDLSDIVAGITWASGGAVAGVPANPTRAQVLNLSLGGPAATCSPSLQSAIDGAVGRGTTVVVAAGNEGRSAQGFEPANCEHVVAVAATGPEGYTTEYSNYGTRIDVAAPGGDVDGYGPAGGVLSTWNTGTAGPGAPGYAYGAGTSMAAPHVTAAVALLLSDRPGTTPAQVESRLEQTAAAGPRCSVSDCGAGIVDVGALLPAPTVIGQKALDLGGTAAFGDPTSGERAVPGGFARNYERARIYRASGSGSAHTVVGDILADFVALGGSGGPLGLPTSDELAVPGGRVSHFVHGDVYWSGATGAHAVWGEILRRYRALGGPGGPVGLPRADEVAVTRGRMSAFTGGNIYWSGSTGAHRVHGDILRTYLTLGGSSGRLGLARTDEYAVPGGRQNDFVGGRLRFDLATGRTSVTYT